MKLICKKCNLEFDSDRNNKKYCSKKCYTETQKWKQHPANIAWKRWIRPKKRTISKCLVCWINFEHHTERKAKYCSNKCWSIRWTNISKKCLYCWGKFEDRKKSKTKYCKRECYNLHLRELKKWDNSHFWKWWKTKESKIKRTCAEYKEWRINVFTRDNYKCVICFVNNKTLEADHIKAFSEYPELIYDVNNWRTLCKECHKKTDNYWSKQVIRMQKLDETYFNLAKQRIENA